MKLPYVVRVIKDKYPRLSSEEVVARLSYSTFVSLPHRYMFFELPKAACTTMKALINRIEGGSPVLKYHLDPIQSHRAMFIHSRENVAAPCILDFNDDTQKTILTSPDFLRFAIVRNPYARLISAWESKVVLCEPGFESEYVRIAGSLPPISEKHLLPFPDFLAYVQRSDPSTFNSHWRLQSDYLFYDALNFSFVGKLETLNDAISLLKKHIGNDIPLELGRANPSAFRGNVALTNEQQNTIYEIYRRDFENFGYQRTDVPHARSAQLPGNAPDLTSIHGEIIERNMIISLLVRERSELLLRLRWTPRGLLQGVGRKLHRLAHALTDALSVP